MCACFRSTSLKQEMKIQFFLTLQQSSKAAHEYGHLAISSHGHSFLCFFSYSLFLGFYNSSYLHSMMGYSMCIHVKVITLNQTPCLLLPMLRLKSTLSDFLNYAPPLFMMTTVCRRSLKHVFPVSLELCVFDTYPFSLLSLQSPFIWTHPSIPVSAYHISLS